MKIYNKTFLYIGFILFMGGEYLDYLKNYNCVYFYILSLLGIILMLIAFKKPKEVKE